MLAGTKVLEAAARAGLTIDTPCGGEGTCGKCRVLIVGSRCEPMRAEREHFSPRELDEGWRLACQTTICAPCSIRTPAGSLFADSHQILTTTHNDAAELLPAVRKVHLPTGEADAKQLREQLGYADADAKAEAALTEQLRRGADGATAVIIEDTLAAFEPGDTAEACFGAAFDVGTTTVAGSLLDLSTGGELAVASAMNPQVRFGDDVISRIKHASSPAGADELARAIRGAIDELIGQLCIRARAARESIYELTFAGNTTMQHLLFGLDVAPLGRLPFEPVSLESQTRRAVSLGLGVNECAPAYAFPIIGGFIGGDTIAGILVTDLAEGEQPALLVDIGTNGEIALACGGELFVASTAAGPAFEGARISCGMRATTGAIEKIILDRDVRYSVIGGAAPVGICGSALVDIAAELLRCGVLSPVGRLLPPEELPDALPEPLRRRVSRDDASQTRFLLAAERGRRIQLLQRDFRELQLAAGAIRAGTSILLDRCGLAAGDLECILIAGGFGSFIRRNHAQRIGLLPTGVDHNRMHFIGNVSLNGAKWALLSTAVRTRARELGRLARRVDLSADADFQNRFAEAMIFPESG